MEGRDNFLAVKVMRLTRPSLYSNIPITSEPQDLPGSIWENELRKDIGCAPEVCNFSTGNMLLLPQSFGTIYLGETFSSYITVNNDSTQVVNGVTLKADLQTNTQKTCLLSPKSDSGHQLNPGQCIDDVINHEVKEMGTHIITCSVSYLNDSGEEMHFRKFYKFQATKPLDVKTKLYNAESDEVYLEAQIQNITASPIFLEKVTLDPTSSFNVLQFNCLKNDTSQSVFGTVNCLNSRDSRQYLYSLTPKINVSTNIKQLKGALNIGKLDIVWRSNMGERGRLQTSQLQRMAPGYGDIKLTVEEMPDVVYIEKPFIIKCKISNLCDRTMDLVLTLDNVCNPNLVWSGISGNKIGKLDPHTSYNVKLDLIPVQAGLQTISGIKLMDTLLKRTYDHDEIAQIFVLN